jgi:MoxR-like ATPase
MATKKEVVLAKSKKIDWPEHCTDVEFEQWATLGWEELRVLLAIMGTDIALQPKGKDKDELVDTMLVKLALDTVIGQHAYEMIVLKKAPEGYVPDQTAFTDRRFREETNALLRQLKDDALLETVGKAKRDAEEIRRQALSTALEAVTKEARAWLDTHMAKHREIVIKSGSSTRVVKGRTHSCFDRVLKLAAHRKNIALVGPAGCGKTFLAEQVAQALDLPFAAQSMSAGVSESTFTGWLLPMGKNGEYTHVPAPFLDVYEGGGVFLFDEADNADANMLVFLNMSLGNPKFFLPIRRGKTEVKKHKDFVAIAAMNTYGHGGDMRYVGRSQLDAATLDRFRIGMVSMDYDYDLEAALVSHEVHRWGMKVRQAITNGGIERIMSTRSLIDAHDMVEAGWTLDQVREAYFSDWTQDERRLVQP